MSKNEWAEFYANQSTEDANVLWVEREKEKIDWTALAKKVAEKGTDLVLHTDYRALAGRLLRIGGRLYSEPLLQRTVKGVMFATLVLVSFTYLYGWTFGSGAYEQAENEVLSDVVDGPQPITFEPIVPKEADSEVTFDTIVGSAIVRDDIDGAPIVISQQALPDEAAASEDYAKDVAQSVPNSLRIESFTTKLGRAHLATSYNGTQALVIATDDILITMTSNLIIYASDWSDYLNTLASN